jgi:hypothetical protein
LSGTRLASIVSFSDYRLVKTGRDMNETKDHIVYPFCEIYRSQAGIVIPVSANLFTVHA